MRSLLLMTCALALALPAAADTMSSVGEKKKCCVSDKGPEPVPYTGKWLDGLFTREECVAKKYGYWAGDEPNMAKKVCAIRESKPPPEDPVPPPPEDHGDGGKDEGTKKP
jgi:hypothetical protein